MPVAGGFQQALSGIGFNAPTPSTLKPEPIEGNSLTRFLRSTNNWAGQQAQQLSQAGGNLLQAGGGLVDRGVDTFEKPLDYWSALLSGDKDATARAVAPTAANISSQYDAAGRSAATNLPRGGARSTIMSELPFQKAGQISNEILKQQPMAADKISGIAAILSGLGIDVSKLGLAEQGLSEQFLSTLLNSLLGGRGQDVAEHGQAIGMAGQLGSAFMGGIGQGYSASRRR